MKAGSRCAVLAALVYAAAAAVRPLNANDLFWHLATGREILRTGKIPLSDPFSFTSGGKAWIDHEWLWQVAAESVYRTFSRGADPGPSPSGNLALVGFGALVVALAFAIALTFAARRGLPAAAIAVLGVLAAETARERLMLRPETASLVFLAALLAILGGARPGLRRGLALFALTSFWVSVHAAALLSPIVVFLEAVGERFGPGREGPRSSGPTAFALEPALALAGTLVSPYGWRVWTVPLQLRQLVRTRAFFNPEWLPPPLARFPLFWAAAGLCAAGAVWMAVRTRKVPAGPVLVALLLAGLASRQMRHMGLFAIASLFAAVPILRGVAAGSKLARALDRRAVALAASAACALASAVSIPGWAALEDEGGLDPGRFPVRACEEIARKAPELRLYNDVRFGGYLIWRFFPSKKVFIDGRNEVYPELLERLGRIASGEAPYSDWRALVRELRIEGALVRYNQTLKGVIYPPVMPGGPEIRGMRAWSAYLFPSSEWALVWFDDASLVFMRRGGGGESWISEGEYRDLNLEDEEYLLARAAHEPSFAESLRAEAARRISEAPRCRRLEAFLDRLEDAAPRRRTAAESSASNRLLPSSGSGPDCGSGGVTTAQQCSAAGRGRSRLRPESPRVLGPDSAPVGLPSPGISRPASYAPRSAGQVEPVAAPLATPHVFGQSPERER